MISAKIAYTVFGHVCGDFSAPTVRIDKARGEATRSCAFGVNGLPRGELRTPQQLGINVENFSGNQGWNFRKLPFSKGGPAASAALAIFQLAQPHGELGSAVAFRGLIGDDWIGNKVADYFGSYKMDSSFLVRVPGATTSHTLVLNEQIEDDPECHRTFIHDKGLNETVGIESLPDEALQLPAADRNIVMIGGSFLMPRFHATAVQNILRAAKAQNAVTIFNTVCDPDDTWKLFEGAPQLIDLLITDSSEALRLSGCITAADIKEHEGKIEKAVARRFVNWELGLSASMSSLSKMGFQNIMITDGIRGSRMLASGSETGNSVFRVWTPENRMFSSIFSMPASQYIIDLKQPKWGLGAGDCSAGGLAIAAGEQMDHITAAAFAMSAGGRCVLNEPGEIGGPCEQGGHRAEVDDILSRLKAQLKG